jgi:hypothetical protein
MLGSTTLIATTIFASAALGAPAETQVASCDPGPVMIGSGKATWRRESLDAGPLGIRRRPLRDMSVYSPARPDLLVTKAPLLVESHDPVTLSVPPRLAHRVFLYYGFHKGRDGGRSTSFFDYPGASTVEFRPCVDKPRTVWPGGIRVKGRKPVHLLVTVEGEPDAIPLRLGKPTLYAR